MGVIIGLLWFVLVVVMLLLAGVILLQEGKGGGLAEAFGGAGGETFGVKASGINRFTGILSGVFLAVVILINICISKEQSGSLAPAPPAAITGDEIPVPEGDGAAGGEPEGN